MSRPLISIVVPTRDRPEALARCLDALDEQSEAGRLEVIVVDDGSLAPARISTIVESHARARLIRSPGLGPAAARNAGARAALGTYLCFTDDDCVPERTWVEELVRELRLGADAAAGTTIPARGALSEASELVAHAPVHSRLYAGRGVPFAPSNNLAVRKAVFDAVPFDESYTLAAGEDREWCARIVDSGRILRFAPAARLVHGQELTLRTFLRQQMRYGEGAFRFRRRGSTPHSFEPPGFYAALVRSGFARSLAVGLLVSTAQAATAVGFVRAWMRLRTMGPARDAGAGRTSAAPWHALRQRWERRRRT